MRFFRKSGGPHDFAVSMVGVKMGDRLLALNSRDGRLFAALAAKVGLTGRASTVEQSAEAAARVRDALARAGVHAEIDVAPFDRLPYDADAFDLVVVRDLVARVRPETRVRCLQESWRVLRPGGRCLILERSPRSGLGALFGAGPIDPHYRASGGAEGALAAERFRAVRRLAEREGLAFFEGTKPRQ